MSCEFNETVSMTTLENCINITETTSHLPDFDVNAKNILIAITLTLLDLVTIFGNLMVLVAFLVDSKLRQPFNLFIFNLAITDFLVAITAMTFYTIDTLLSYWPFGRVMCGVWIYFDFAMTFASVYTLVAISIDRFWCVTWSYNYKIKNTKNKVVLILIIVWLLVIVTWTPPFIYDRQNNVKEPTKCIWEPNENRNFWVFLAISHYTPCIIMVGCYCKVFLVMKRQAKRVAANLHVSKANTSATVQSKSRVSGSAGETAENDVGQKNPAFKKMNQDISRSNTKETSLQSSTPTKRIPIVSQNVRTNETMATQSNAHSRDKKIFVTLTYVLSSYLICWFPFYVTFDTYAWKPELVPEGLYTFFFWMTYVNSTLNPFIYAYTSKDFRVAFMKVIRLTFTCKIQ